MPDLQQSSDVPGLAARRIAADILDAVLRRRRPLDEQLEDKGADPDFLTMLRVALLFPRNEKRKHHAKGLLGQRVSRG